MTHWLDIVGVGEAGIAALGPRERGVIAAARTVLGPPRLLAGLDPTQQTLVEWQSPLARMIEQVEALAGTPTVVLATGDPSWFGIGATLTRFLPAGSFAVHPHPSSFSLAAARLRWPLQNVATLSLHGRPVEAIHGHILPGNRILALTSDRTTVAAVQAILAARGYGESLLTALENLGGPAEKLSFGTAAQIDAETLGDFLVLAIDCVAGPEAPLLPAIPGLPDSAFESDGQLTKRDVRATTLAKLAPYPGALLWDIGAGSGSICIEWMRAARDAKAIAFERDAGRLAAIARNAANLGVPDLAVIAGQAPESLAGQPIPDAIFIGGDAGNDALVQAAWAALRKGGRMVVNAVTLDGEQSLLACQQRHGGELTRLDIAVLDSVGSHRVLRPRLPVLQWLAVK